MVAPKRIRPATIAPSGSTIRPASVRIKVESRPTQLAPYLSASSAGGQELNIHATYGSGGVMVNGKKAAEMPPLDWSLLTSLPPAQAPGDGSGAAGQ